MEAVKVAVKVWLFLACIATHHVQSETREEYMAKRDQVIYKEWTMRTGGNIKLTPKEEAVNKVLMQFKSMEFDEARQPNGTFPPEIHFFKARPLIEQSRVFHIIKEMPKGETISCNYHGHWNCQCHYNC